MNGSKQHMQKPSENQEGSKTCLSTWMPAILASILLVLVYLFMKSVGSSWGLMIVYPVLLFLLLFFFIIIYLAMVFGHTAFCKTQPHQPPKPVNVPKITAVSLTLLGIGFLFHLGTLWMDCNRYYWPKEAVLCRQACKNQYDEGYEEFRSCRDQCYKKGCDRCHEEHTVVWERRSSCMGDCAERYPRKKRTGWLWTLVLGEE